MIEVAAGDVHLWHGLLSVPERRLSEYQQLLSPDEQARAKRYVRAEHAARFTVGRGMLREVLSSYTDILPHALAFAYGRQGKPDLDQSGELRFNAAHSDDRLVIGVTCGRAIGIDIERIRSLPDMAQLSERFLPALDGLYRGELSGDPHTAFFQRWTRTEALLKATGAGITGLEQLKSLHLSEWTICQIDAPIGFVAALAVEGQTNRITRMEL